MKHRTGAVFIAFAAYTNEDGEQTYARFDSSGLQKYIGSNLLSDMKQRDFSFLHHERTIGKVPTISWTCGQTLTSVSSDIPMWSPLMICCHPESAEDMDSNETLELDDDEYPLLPENVLDLHLRRQKAVLRQYMAAVRCTYPFLPTSYADR